MTLKAEGDTLTFSTGRKATANMGIVGINAKMETYEGYDGNFPWWVGDYGSEPLTSIEREELADHMIALWQAFKTQAER